MWHLVTRQYQVREWDGQSVIYNGLTGGTHLVQPFVVELLGLLATSPQSETDLAHALVDQFDEKPADLADRVRKTLLDLTEIYLVEQDE